MFKEKIEKLIGIINNSNSKYADEDIDSISKVITGFGEYFKSVISMESQLQTARFRLEDEDFRNFAQRLDSSRRIRHDACLADINLVNKMAALYNTESPFPNIQDMDRTKVADDIIFATAREYYEERS